MAERHRRDFFFLADQNTLVGAVERPATPSEQDSAFRFSQIVRRGAAPSSDALLRALAEAMVSVPPEIDGDVPAGFTYLGQFVDHDLTRDVTKVPFNTSLTVDQLSQGRSPALDLDSVFGLGPNAPDSPHRYQADGAQLVVGKTAAAGPGPIAALSLDGFDLPRLGARAATDTQRRSADIPDPRNDENLSIAQLHLAFMRFHNFNVRKLAAKGIPSALLFESAREDTVKHYQWMLVNDFLPRIVDADVLRSVVQDGRKIVQPSSATTATMPIEFSVAAYRFGHSMIRDAYDWNLFFNDRPGPPTIARGSLLNLFRFSGTSGNLSPGSDINNPLDGDFERLPSNWVADWTRLFDFVADAAIPQLAPEPGASLNIARRIDPRLTDPLAALPLGSFGGRGSVVADDLERNLAFRNLVRGRMVGLASAQEVVAHFTAQGVSVRALGPEEILAGAAGGLDLTGLADALKAELTDATPLWFYVLREAELNGGKLGDIGGRIVAETFHRAMEASRMSILRDPTWRPDPGRHPGGFGMVDILLRAYGAKVGELRPLSPDADRPPDDGIGPRSAPTPSETEGKSG
ncbi:MAG: heme peroxidase [Enterovirga sp.]|nr:heme peroxidase [Enterovirga sp.]